MTEAIKKIVTMSIWVTIILFVFRCLIGLGELIEIKNNVDVLKGCYTLFGYAGEAIGVAVILMACFNKWFWKCKLLNLLAGGMPILAKQYKGKVRFSYDGQDQERDVNIVINQTFLNIKVKLETDESFSNSVTAKIETVNNAKMLIYSYLNTPRAELQNRSAIHYGTTMLCIEDPKHLTGNYFTSRLSRGSMDIEAVGSEKSFH